MTTPDLNTLGYLGLKETNPPNIRYLKRDPTALDISSFDIGDFWINTVLQRSWQLMSKAGGVAGWQLMGSATAGVFNLTPDGGGAVAPVAGNIGISGTNGIQTSNGGPGVLKITATYGFAPDVGAPIAFAAGNINILGDGNGIETANGGPNTINVTNAFTFTPDAGAPISFVAGDLAIDGAAGIAIGSSGPGEISITPSDDLAAIEALATTGVVSRTAADTWATSTITDHAIIIGDGGQLLNNIGPLTNGQLVIGSTGADPVAGSLTSVGGSVVITPGAGTINLEAGGGVATTYTAEDATIATPALGNINLIGTATNGISTTAAGSTVTISMDSPFVGDFSFTNAAAATPRTLSVVNTDTDPGSYSALSATAANTGGDPFVVTGVTGTQYYSMGIDNSVAGDPWKLTNNVNPSTGDAIISSTSAGVITLFNDLDVTEGGTGVSTLTSHGVLMGNGAGDIQATAEPADGELLIGKTGDFPQVASLTAGANISITPGAGSISIAATIPAFATVNETKIGTDATTIVNPADIGGYMDDLTFTGFVSWAAGGPYFDDTTLGTFDLLVGGTGYIKGKLITWTAQSIAGLTAGNTYYIYIDSSGTIGKTATRTDALFEDNIVLFECLRDSTPVTNNQVTVKENHPYNYSATVSNYEHHNIGVLIENNQNGANIVLNGTQGIQINGADVLSDHGLETTIPDSAGAAVTWNRMYTNAVGKWARQNATTTFTGFWNNGGTPTALTANRFAVYTLYVSKDNLNSTTPVYFAVLDTSQYGSQAAANTAIANGTTAKISGELAQLELAQLGYIIYRESTTAISTVIISKKTLTSSTSTSGTNQASLVLTDTTNFNHWLSAANTNVQSSLDTLDDILTAGGAGTVLAGAAGLPTFTATPSVTSITISNAPSAGTDGTNKTYVDNVAAGFDFKDTTVAASTVALTVTYANGAAGVGATLTNAGAQAAFSLDGQSPTVGQRVLIKDQASSFQNGIYTVTNVGSGASNWVLTRATDYDTPLEMQNGSLIPVSAGTLNANTMWLQNVTVVTIGADAITYQKFQSKPLSSPVAIAEGGTNATSMANTDGVVYYDGTRLVTTAVGTATHVLTSNGAGVAPTFQAAAAGGVTGPGSSTDRAISTWNGTGGTALFNNSTVKIDSTGIMTNTTQPAFLVYLSSGSPSIGATCPFNSEVFDIGSNFTTGASAHFTAPVTGKYQFDAKAIMANISTLQAYILQIVTTSKTSLLIVPGMASASVSISGGGISGLLDMTAGDTASFAVFGSSSNAPTYYGSAEYYITFSGFLVC